MTEAPERDVTFVVTCYICSLLISFSFEGAIHTVHIQTKIKKKYCASEVLSFKQKCEQVTVMNQCDIQKITIMIITPYRKGVPVLDRSK